LVLNSPFCKGILIPHFVQVTKPQDYHTDAPGEMHLMFTAMVLFLNYKSRQKTSEFIQGMNDGGSGIKTS